MIDARSLSLYLIRAVGGFALAKFMTRKQLRKDIMGPRGLSHLPYDQREHGKDVKVIERVINKAIRDKEGQYKQTFYHISTPRIAEMGLPELVAIYFIVVETFENLC